MKTDNYVEITSQSTPTVKVRYWWGGGGGGGQGRKDGRKEARW